jgi:transcriptional regulator with XRE-family HTH domain
MKPKEFKRWRKALGLSQSVAAKKLGLKLRTVQYYEKGERRGKKIDIPKTVELACFVISCGVEEVDYAEPEGRAVDRTATKRILSPKAASE